MAGTPLQPPGGAGETALQRLLAKARDNLGAEASGAARQALEARLQSLAAELALEWIVGERRFESQGQQTEYWLARLYEELFVDEQPEATRLYARFGLSLARAQYLARLLLARRASHWRAAARVEVKALLAELEEGALGAQRADALKVQRFERSLSRGGYDELVVLYDAMASALHEDVRPAPPRRIPSSPSLVWFSVTAETVLKLLELVRKPAP
jgi:hypothetical protein